MANNQPEVRRSLLNGWHRLWILFAVITGLAAAAVIALRSKEVTPTIDETVSNAMSDHDRAKFWRILESSPFSHREVVLFPEDIPGFRIENRYEIPAEITEANRVWLKTALINAAQSEASVERFEIIKEVLFYWVTLALAVLALGHSVAWVIRGFSTSQ